MFVFFLMTVACENEVLNADTQELNICVFYLDFTIN